MIISLCSYCYYYYC